MPFAVSPCCIGKLQRDAASTWLRDLLRAAEQQMEQQVVAEQQQADEGERVTWRASSRRTSFRLLAAWADASSLPLRAPNQSPQSV